jgi:cytochrome c
MKSIAVGIGLALALLAGIAQAASAEDKAWAAAQKDGCTKCHAIDRAKVGPAWQELHEKYKHDPGAKARVSAKLKNSGGDHPEINAKPGAIENVVIWVADGPERTATAFKKGYTEAERAGCTKCHSVDPKKVGPAWKDVAAKYKSDPNAASRLDAKLKNAGEDHPEIKLTDKDRKVLVPWILSL